MIVVSLICKYFYRIMGQRITSLALVVRDYDEAIAYYTEKVGFELIEDTPMEPGKRWVVVKPRGSEAALLLAKAKNASQASRIGDQTGGRVFLFIETDHFDQDYDRMLAAGVHFTEKPRDEVYGKVVVWEDLYGNKWDLIQRK